VANESAILAAKSHPQIPASVHQATPGIQKFLVIEQVVSFMWTFIINQCSNPINQPHSW